MPNRDSFKHKSPDSQYKSTQTIGAERVEKSLRHTQDARVAGDGEGRRTVQVTPQAHEAFSTACSSRSVDRSMFKAASQLFVWFSQQSEIVQTAVTSDVDRGMEEAYAAALRRLADEIEQRPAFTVRHANGTVTAPSVSGRPGKP